jgi:transcriptional regulator with XRE-family HTH domain
MLVNLSISLTICIISAYIDIINIKYRYFYKIFGGYIMSEFLGRAITYFRDAKNMTQTDLARKTGIAQPNISAYEAGRRTPSEDNLTLIAEALDVTIEDIKSRADRFRQNTIERVPDELYRRRVESLYRVNDVVIELTNDVFLGIKVRAHDIPYEISQQMIGRKRYGMLERNPSSIEAVVERVIRAMLHDHEQEIIDRLQDELMRTNFTIEEIIENIRNSQFKE